MGCLFVLLAGIFPRLGLFIVWVARPNLVDAAFSTWIWPLLGFIFLPFATLMYVVLWQVGGLSGWGLVLGGPGRPAGPHPRWRELDAAPAGTGLPSGCPGLTRADRVPVAAPQGCRHRPSRLPEQAVAQRRRQGRGQRQPRDQRGLEGVVGVRLALPGHAARPVRRGQLVPPRPVLGVERSSRRRGATRWRTSRRTTTRPSRRAARRRSRWPRPRPSASARGRRATVPVDGVDEPVRTVDGPALADGGVEQRRARRRAASPGQRRPRPARRCRASRAHSSQCPMVAPYGRNGCAGSSTLYSSCGVHVASKCSGIRHSLARAEVVHDPGRRSAAPARAGASSGRRRRPRAAPRPCACWR